MKPSPMLVRAATTWIFAPALLAASAAGLEVTHIANAGFLVAAGEEKVIVDGAFDAGLDGYPKIPEALRPDLEGAEGRFAGVDLILATHHHRDHFGPRAVVRHLRADPEAIFVSTGPAVEAVLAHPEAEGLDRDRLRAVDPGEGETVVVEHRGVRVEVLRLHHGRSWATDPNLGFLVEMGEERWLHVGDTVAGDEEVAVYGLEDRGIDVAFLTSWFLSGDRWAPIVDRRLRPREIVVMHLPGPDAPPSYFGSAGSLGGWIERIRDRFPDAIVMERGETRILGAD